MRVCAEFSFSSQKPQAGQTQITSEKKISTSQVLRPLLFFIKEFMVPLYADASFWARTPSTDWGELLHAVGILRQAVQTQFLFTMVVNYRYCGSKLS